MTSFVVSVLDTQKRTSIVMRCRASGQRRYLIDVDYGTARRLCPLRIKLYSAEYPASAVLRTSPSPRRARPVPRGRPVGLNARPRDGASRVAAVFLPYVPSPLPRRNGWVRVSLASPTLSAFPPLGWGQLPHHAFRGLLSVHSRYGPHSRGVAIPPFTPEALSRLVACYGCSSCYRPERKLPEGSCTP